MAWFKRLAGALQRETPQAAATAPATSPLRSATALLDEYVDGAPSAQNAVDALPGWNTALPPEVGAVAGPLGLYHDARILWGLEQFGSVEGRRVLELGPLEASHTAIVEARGPATLHAIEANRLSYLRCLVVKELMNLRVARFFLGNFVPWLERGEERYDFIIASGVLYHMADPVRLIELMAKNADSLLIWTHYYCAEAMKEDDPRRQVFVGEPTTTHSHGLELVLHPRSYWGAWRDASFCGGMYDLHHWMERDGLLGLLNALGYDQVSTAFDEPDHPNGPAFAVFARRSRPTATPPQG